MVGRNSLDTFVFGKLGYTLDVFYVCTIGRGSTTTDAGRYGNRGTRDRSTMIYIIKKNKKIFIKTFINYVKTVDL